MYTNVNLCILLLYSKCFQLWFNIPSHRRAFRPVSSLGSQSETSLFYETVLMFCKLLCWRVRFSVGNSVSVSDKPSLVLV
jgi:hypothetical protein